MTTEPNPETNIVALPPPETPPRAVLVWTRELDPHENTVLMALSHALGDAEGKPCFSWVTHPVLRRDAIKYSVAESAPALLPDGASKLLFDDAGAAQAWCERIETELGGGAPEYAQPEAESAPIVADKLGYCPTHKIIARWSRNGGVLTLWRVWAKPDDPAQTQEREIEEEAEYEAALVQCIRQQLLAEVARRMLSGWTAPITAKGRFGVMTLQVEVEFVRCVSLTWHRPAALHGNVSRKQMEPCITVILDAPTHDDIVRMVALTERRQRLALEQKAEGKSEDELRAEIMANAAAAGVTGGEVLPVTLEDMQAAGVDPTKGVR